MKCHFTNKLRETMIEELSKFNLIQKKLNNETVNLISAREVWQRLQVKSKFADWIKNRIEKYEFLPNIDFIVSKKKETIKTIYEGAKVEIEYYITINMAKELCMVENNEIGKQFRKFFIECEKELYSIARNRYIQIENRKDLTTAIKKIYEPVDRFYVYTNYTKLIYRKIFGFSDIKHIKKKYKLSPKEEIRKSLKIPYDIQEQITNTEDAVRSLLTCLRYQKAPKEICYQKVKEFLQLDN